jgi:uncharacterized protein (DUF3084 family)
MIQSITDIGVTEHWYQLEMGSSVQLQQQLDAERIQSTLVWEALEQSEQDQEKAEQERAECEAQLEVALQELARLQAL